MMRNLMHRGIPSIWPCSFITAFIRSLVMHLQDKNFILRDLGTVDGRRCILQWIGCPIILASDTRT